MWLTLAKWLASFVTGPIFTDALQAYQAKLAAGTSADEIASTLAGKQMVLDQREAEVQAQVVIAEQGNWLTRCVRPLFAMPFIIFLWKVVVYDKVLGLGVTDNLSADEWKWGGIVLVAYFGGRSIERASTSVASILATKK